MPVQRIEFNGKIHEFPDDFTDEDIAAALDAEDDGPRTPPDNGVTIGARNASTAQKAFEAMQGMGGIPGVLVGAAKQGLNTVAQGGDLLRAGWNKVAPDSMDVERPYQQAGDIPPTSPYERVGIRAVQGAEAAQGVKALTQAPGLVAKGLGISKARAAANLDDAAAAAKGVAVNTADTFAAGARAQELKAAGGRMPLAARLFMKRIGDVDAPDLTFEEARDFYSNLSRLSANEANALNPVMQRQIGAMKQALHEALTEAADTVGKGDQYAAGIREYSRSAKAAKGARWAGGVAGGMYGANYILSKITNALSAATSAPR